MIKTALITIAALTTTAGASFTPAAQSVIPSQVNVTAGILSLQGSADGTTLAITPKPDFAFRVTTQSGRNITLRF